jgi:hypothetical protein
MSATADDAGSNSDDAARRSFPRFWLVAHLVSLALIAVLLVFAGRGLWFYYDEWDFLAARAEWHLLAPHNGHLSLFPQLLTTLVKGVVGLHSYWPYLALTFAAHLAAVHMIWRIMMRVAVTPAIALLVAVLFGVLAPGADNSLWAFQVGFITPIVTGIGALLLAMRPQLTIPRLVWIIVLLLVGVGFASTGLPFVVAIVLFVWGRHGWRRAGVIAVAFALVYGTWYLLFARGTTGADGFGIHSLKDLVLRVPEFFAHGLVDSLGKTLPYAGLAAALTVAVGIGMIVDLRRASLRRIDPTYALVVAAFAFGALTAITRVNLGTDAASAGRYVYIYGALLAPVIGRLLTALAANGRVAVGAVSAVLLILIGYNAAGLVEAGRGLGAYEQSVNRAISAAITIDDGSAALAKRTPSPFVAPTLTMADIRSFVERGQYTPVPYTPSDLLEVRVNLFLHAVHVPGSQPDPTTCAVPTNGYVAYDPSKDLVYIPKAGTVGVFAKDGEAKTFTHVPIAQPGMHDLIGLEPPISMTLAAGDAGGVCVVPRP